MAVDVEALTAILADRFAAIIPAGFHVEASDGMLWYSADAGRFPGQAGDYRVGRAGSHIRDNLGVYSDTDEENIIGVAVQALDELQDYVSEASHDPWPGRTGQPPPHGQIRDSALHLWYGDPGQPGLACEPIALTAITDRA
jgi:hypothetical protein